MHRPALSTICLSLFMLTVLVSPVRAGTVTAYQISSGGQLLSGSYADGQVGDIMMENDSIAVVITALGHTEYYGVSGGNIIDAGSSTDRADAIAEVYTYFNDTWPRQASYSSLTIIDNGAGGGPAIVRATGVDTDNAQLAVSTDYILDVDDVYMTISTTVTNNGGPPVNSFELGEGFAWGSCGYFAPPHGFTLTGVTRQPWIAGYSIDGVSYGYFGADVDTIWGDHGAGWSDMNDTTVSIAGSGGSATYDRYFVVGRDDLASVATRIHAITGVPAGSLSCNVTVSGGGPLAGVTVDVFDVAGGHYLQMLTNATGDGFTTLPAGDWRVVASESGYASEEAWKTITNGGSLTHNFVLGIDSTAEAIGDTLTVIQRPLLNIPAMILSGDTLSIECDASPATTGWTASLERGATTIPLSIVSSSYDPTTEWWTVHAEIPTVPVHELYDLIVTADGGIQDRTWNAVRVISEFKDDFYFVQISDTHLPTHAYYYEPGAENDTTEMEDLREVIADVSLINPEFVLVTGDVINEGELEDFLTRRYFTKAQRVIAEFEVPVYLTSGNHDLGGWDDTPPPDGTARREWWRFFGWKRLDSPPAGAPWYTQNYSFDYGSVHFTALESYINYDDWRSGTYGNDSFTSGQMSWLASDLAAASGSAAQVLYYHYDFSNQINLNSLGVEMALYGHIHSNAGSIASPPYNLATDNVCDGARSYRLIRVSNGVLQPTQTIATGATGSNLYADYLPANDGTNSAVTAEITNSMSQGFEHGMVRFNMPGGGGTALVTGGTLVQVDDSGATSIYYVAVDIQPNVSQQTVSIVLNQTDVPQDLPVLPPTVRLAQNHPNPFNPMTTFRYELPEAEDTRFVIYDARGRQVVMLINEHRNAGAHEVIWNGEDARGRQVSSGVYFAQLVAGGEIRTRKIALTR